MDRIVWLSIIILSLLAVAFFTPIITTKTTINLSELSRLIDTSDSIRAQLETACINALENNVDYSAKANGVVMLKDGHTVESDIVSEMTRVLQSFVDKNNFVSPPVVTVNSVTVGGKNYSDGDGRNSNFGSVGSADVTVDGFSGNFPAVQATITFRFRSILSEKTRPSITHTVGAELNHTNILQNNWN